MKRNYPWKLLFSGVVKNFKLNAVVGIAGVCFIIIGVFAFAPFKIIGALVFALYLLICILQPARNISGILKEMDEVELDELMDAASYSYDKVMLAVEDKMRLRNTDDND